MFNNLIESGSHKEDVKRKSSFLLGTLALYAVLLLIAAVASIYAYDAHLENQDWGVVMLAPPSVNEPAPPPSSHNEPRPAVSTKVETPTRIALIAPPTTPHLMPKDVSSKSSPVPPLPPGGAKLGPVNIDLTNAGGPNSVLGSSGGTHTGKPVIALDGEPPSLPKATPTPGPKPVVRVSEGVLNGKALSKPPPTYPQIAKTARASGAVTVQIVVDEKGRVISARAISGHPLLQPAAQQAAYQARFSPTLLSKEPVKVSGVITYNFVLQ